MAFSLPLLLRFLALEPGPLGLRKSPEKCGEATTILRTIAVAGRMTFG